MSPTHQRKTNCREQREGRARRNAGRVWRAGFAVLLACALALDAPVASAQASAGGQQAGGGQQGGGGSRGGGRSGGGGGGGSSTETSGTQGPGDGGVNTRSIGDGPAPQRVSIGCPDGSVQVGFICEQPATGRSFCPQGYAELNGRCLRTDPCPAGQTDQGGACVPSTAQPGQPGQPACPQGQVAALIAGQTICRSSQSPCPPGYTTQAVVGATVVCIPPPPQQQPPVEEAALCPDGVTPIEGRCTPPLVCAAGFDARWLVDAAAFGDRRPRAACCAEDRSLRVASCPAGFAAVDACCAER